MTLIEAIQSERRFKRPGWIEFHHRDQIIYLTSEDILADDYELETAPEKTVTITKAQLKHALWSVFKITELNTMGLSMAKELHKACDEVCAKLGLD